MGGTLQFEKLKKIIFLKRHHQPYIVSKNSPFEIFRAMTLYKAFDEARIAFLLSDSQHISVVKNPVPGLSSISQ